MTLYYYCCYRHRDCGGAFDSVLLLPFVVAAFVGDVTLEGAEERGFAAAAEPRLPVDETDASERDAIVLPLNPCRRSGRDDTEGFTEEFTDTNPSSCNMDYFDERLNNRLSSLKKIDQMQKNVMYLNSISSILCRRTITWVR
jgi:hypothetical protein